MGNTMSPLTNPFATLTGETPFTKDAISKTIDEAIVKESSSKANNSILKQVKETLTSLFSSGIGRDLELYGQLRTADLDDITLEELYQFFLEGKSSAAFDSEVDDTLLNDALHPNPIAARLWGNNIMLKSWENLKFTKIYHENPGNYTSDFDSPQSQKQFANVDGDKYDYLPEIIPFSTGFDELYHHKMLRLAEDFYNFRIDTDLGAVQFDLFCRAYEISPGEDTLDRVHPFPTPEHTYEELPIIKFDGYEESDDPDIYKLAEHGVSTH